jgi:tRNA/rRNA methyltransferase
MANTGFSDLRYSGELDTSHEEAKKFAVHAQGILENAVKAANFKELISSSDRVVGLSMRTPYSDDNTIGLCELQEYISHCKTNNLSVGLLFGNEQIGLDNKELSVCAKNICLNTSENYPSMNLAQAVLVTLWEIKDTKPYTAEKAEYADRKKINTLFNKIDNCLTEFDYYNEQNPDHIRMEIRRMIETKNLTSRETEILLSVFGKMLSRYSHLKNNR